MIKKILFSIMLIFAIQFVHAQDSIAHHSILEEVLKYLQDKNQKDTLIVQEFLQLDLGKVKFFTHFYKDGSRVLIQHFTIESHFIDGESVNRYIPDFEYTMSVNTLCEQIERALIDSKYGKSEKDPRYSYKIESKETDLDISEDKYQNNLFSFILKLKDTAENEFVFDFHNATYIQTTEYIQKFVEGKLKNDTLIFVTAYKSNGNYLQKWILDTEQNNKTREQYEHSFTNWVIGEITLDSTEHAVKKIQKFRDSTLTYKYVYPFKGRIITMIYDSAGRMIELYSFVLARNNRNKELYAIKIMGEKSLMAPSSYHYYRKRYLLFNRYESYANSSFDKDDEPFTITYMFLNKLREYMFNSEGKYLSSKYTYRNRSIVKYKNFDRDGKMTTSCYMKYDKKGRIIMSYEFENKILIKKIIYEYLEVNSF